MKIKPAIICLLGLSCSGKSTIATKLQKENGLCVIPVGDILRNSSDSIIQQTLASDNYVSAATLILPIIKSNLHAKTKSLKPLILDGFPRDEKQLYDYRSEFGMTNNTYYIHLQCPDNICIIRANKRNRSDDYKIRERLKKHRYEALLLPQLHQINVAGVNANMNIEEVHADVTRLIELVVEDNLHKNE